MTVETEVAALTTAVDNLTSAVNVKKATLDASVSDAEAAQGAAAASATTASGHATSAAASASAAASTASGIAGFDLDAIAETKAVTAVDVFVYDTSKDSDGGAWRKRTQHTSWYNETLNTATRGSRREFPAVAVIVAEADKVTIYDGDDPSLPMWMVFQGAQSSSVILVQTTGTSTSSVSAVNGTVTIGTQSNGCHVVSFIADLSRRAHLTLYNTFVSGIVSRNGDGMYSTGGGYTIVNSTVNDVAMTVLPDAPIDPATGVPVPTVAVATDGGVSVIKDDGIVVDITGYSAGIAAIGFTEENRIYVNGQFQERLLTCDIPSVDVDQIAAPNRNSYEFYGGTPRLSAWKPWHEMVSVGDSIVVGSNSTGAALNIVHEKLDDLSSSMVAYTTSTYNTGWLPGDIKLATLSDTDATNVTGSELVTNGDFSGGTSNWTTGGTTLSVSSGQATATMTSTYGTVTQELTTVAGATYTAYVDVISDNTTGAIYLGAGTTSASYNLKLSSNLSVGINAITFEATGTTTYITFFQNGTSGNTTTFDNISVRLAEEDRSVNGNGLQVFGTVTKSAVASGADLVAYSGFNGSNYLEQPYNSALDFGTGDFCVMGWVNVAYDTWGIIVDRYTGSSGRFSLGYTPSGSSAVAEFYINGFRHQGTTLLGSTWRHVTLVRSSGVASLYVDGVLDASFSRTEDVTSSTSAPLIIGKRYDNVQEADQSADIALLRISATAPTAEQIKKIYEDEKVLFQENAACTLYGTSDAVSALAHDPVTDLLHVGTSAGRSVFQGLRRVSNTTTAVGTAISASNSLVVEE